MNKYEALGRYVEAKEELEKLQRTREIFAVKMSEQVHSLQGKGAKNLQRIASEMAETLEKFNECNEKCADLVEQVNEYAEICGRLKVS
ncbi:hypothetical protein F543_2080 [Bibersteinia trehalosi USDA-ARS-USMARC-189]|nr:hypothetical protein [Bibersteinia trehalosi]AHG83072.1 hypothetical protein F543_2080 [Bibersteinia trehalosi USDA-ARS-USMARC-189]